MQTLTRFRQQLDALPHFVVLAASTVPPESGLKAQVRDILESPPDRIYRDGIGQKKNGTLMHSESPECGSAFFKC